MKYGALIGVCAALVCAGCATTDQTDSVEKTVPEQVDVTDNSVDLQIVESQVPETKLITATPASVTRIVEAKPKYPPLVYGVEKPLVCKEPFPATGKMKKRPNLQVMWEHYLYPKPEGIWSEIGGKVEVNGNLPFDQGRWTNACTVRLSHMLNNAEHKIPKLSSKTVSGGNKDQYIYRLADMEAYIIETYGKPDLAITDGTGNSFDLPATPGIVLTDLPDNSFTGHITIWNGAGTVDGSEIGGYRVLFWELPCFLPPERQEKRYSASNVID